MTPTIGAETQCLQLNQHRAHIAHVELLNFLNTKPDTMCLLQETYTVKGKLVTKPRGMDSFPAQSDSPWTAIYTPKKIRAKEVQHLGMRDCTAVLFWGEYGWVLAASVYLDITQTVTPLG